MALISCPECKKEISDKAQICPNCGYPISKEHCETIQEPPLSKEKFPDFPVIMNVGKQIANWKGDTSIDGLYFHSENVVNIIPEGDVSVELSTNGIVINKGLTFYYISNLQITKLAFTNKETIVEESKSVIGRAAIGGILLGPIGAVIGGLSGTGTTNTLKGKYYLVINFWDVYTKKQQTILICTKETPQSFIDRYNKEKSQNNIPEGNDYVVNVFNEDQTLNEDKIIEAVKGIDPMRLSIKIEQVTGMKDVYLEVQKIITNSEMSVNDVKSSGCMVTLVVVLSTSILGFIITSSLL